MKALESGRVLIIEEDEDLAQAMQLRLENAGHETVVCAAGQEPVELAGLCDIVLLDVLLSLKNGFEVCRELKENERTKDVQVILVTSLGDSQSKVLGFEGGADGYLVKPFEMRELLARVDAGVRIKRLSDQLRESNLKLEVLSMTDGLTGLLNRRGGDQEFERQFACARQAGYPLSLLMLDINSFKQINDREGHPLGDVALQETARVLREGIGEQDAIGRYGGDEFSVIMPHCLLDRAHEVALSLARKIKEIALDGKQGPFSFSISIGGACCDQRSFEDLQALVRAADNALYRAKDMPEEPHSVRVTMDGG